MNRFAVLTLLIFAGLARPVLGAVPDSERCSAERSGDPQVYSSDYKWNLSLQDVRNLGQSMYTNEKRLAKRAFYDAKTKSFVFPGENERGGNIRIPETFIKAVQKHVEKAFERSYIDAVIFPDMGHSHFLVPLDFYKKNVEPLPVSQTNLVYERMMSNKDTKVVYHTAEQLRVFDDNKVLLNDRYLQWRFFTRNLVGHNNADPDIELFNATATSEANTMGEVPGYYWWGGGFNIHANKGGCFPFKRNGQTYYFDLSLEDLVSDPALGGGEG